MTGVQFAFGCSVDVFPADEIEVLIRHGQALEQLATGQLPPTTSEHRHFLRVDRDEAEPESLLERAWLRLKARREYEAEKAPVPLANVDYGIIEWDREKCWW